MELESDSTCYLLLYSDNFGLGLCIVDRWKAPVRVLPCGCWFLPPPGTLVKGVTAMVGQGTDRRPWFSFGRDPESSKAESHPGIMGSSPARAPLAFLRLAVVFAMSSCCCPPAGSPCAPSPAPHPHHLHHPHHPQPPEREDGASTFPALAGSSLRLRQDVGGRRGRGLFASRAVVAGSLLLQEDAFAFSPHTADSEHTTRSHLTLKEAPALMRCGGCRFALYASEDEQREAWKHHHSDECASIRRCLSYGYSPSSTLLLASRILHR